MCRTNDHQRKDEVNLYPVSIKFINENFRLTWCDIKWGYENHLITSEVPIKKAEESVLTGCYNDTELELSFIFLSEPKQIESFLNKLCSGPEKIDDSKIKNKWLFIVLSWLWDNRNNFEDPLAEVEVIYSDFDYPSEIEGFVKYMPTTDGYDPSVFSQDENVSNLLRKWKDFLEKGTIVFKN